MPKKKNNSKKQFYNKTRQLPIADVGQEYAQVERALGNKRFEVNSLDGKKRIARVRGTIRRGDRILAGNYVVISLREYQDEKADIIENLRPDEVQRLRHMGEIIDINDHVENEDDVEFDYEEEVSKDVNIDDI
tara:strand:+ start:53 stop:451 length:399 start_codon:yes stop_codon:yes gene_type:complete